MSQQSDLGWHHDFPQLVRKLGFKFITNKPKILLDWNAIAVVNIDNVVINQDVWTLEKHINDVVYYNLHGEEFAVLDSKFVKLFRLAQLTIEYLLFCLHYVDQGFVQLQANTCEINEENACLRDELMKKEKALHSCKKKLNDLQNAFVQPQTTMTDESNSVFQCLDCEKQFISAVYLNAHRLRRHKVAKTVITTSEPPEYEQHKKETDRLYLEIKHLKERLNLTERILCKEDSKKKNFCNSPGDLTENSEPSHESEDETSKSVDNVVLKKPQRNSSVGKIFGNNIDKKHSLVESSVQCNLYEKVGNEVQIEFIKTEMNKWKENETNEFLLQLEHLKHKIYADFEKLRAPVLLPDSKESSNINDEIKVVESPITKDKGPNSEVVQLEKKLDEHVQRLQSELSNQERAWETKIHILEKKSYLLNQRRRGSFSIQHNRPVNIEFTSPSVKQRHSKRPSLVTHNTHIEQLVCDSPLSSPDIVPPLKDKIDSSNEINVKSETISSENNSLIENTQNEIIRLSPRAKKYDAIVKQLQSNEDIFEGRPNSPGKQHKNANKTIFTKRDETYDEQNKNYSDELRSMEFNERVAGKQGDVLIKASESTLERRSLTSLTEAITNDPNFLIEFRKTMLELMSSSLKELGVDPDWNAIPQGTLLNHIKRLEEARKFSTKVHPTYYQIRSEILSKVDNEVQKSVCGYPVYKTEENRLETVPYQPKRHSPNKQCMKVSVSPCHSTDRDKKNTRTPPQILHQHYKRHPSNVPNLTKEPCRDDGTLLKNINTYLPEWIHEKPPKKTETNPELNIPLLTEFNATMQKVKDKVLSAFRVSESAPGCQNKQADSVKAQTNVTKGIYKLTVLDGNNESSKQRSILNIKPIREYPRQHKTRVSSSEEDSDVSNVSKIKDTHSLRLKSNLYNHPEKVFKASQIIAERPLDKRPSNQSKIHKSVILNSIENSHIKFNVEQEHSNGNPQDISKNSVPVSPTKLPCTNLPKSPILCSTVTEPRKDSPKRNEFKLKLEHLTNTDIKNEINKEPTTSTPLNGNKSKHGEVENKGLLKAIGSTSSLNKKRVLFDLISQTSLSTTIRSPFKSTDSPNKIDGKSITVNTVSKTGSIENMNESNIVEDNGDSTSISSSVFDGSKLADENEQKNLPPKQSQKIDDLILSDFDLSSD